MYDDWTVYGETLDADHPLLKRVLGTLDSRSLAFPSDEYPKGAILGSPDLILEVSSIHRIPLED